RCNLVQITREVAETYRPQLEAAGFSFQCHWPEAALTVDADRDALAQILVNLLSNVEKYSGEAKSVRLEMSLDESVSSRAFAEVRVLDRGLGVAEGLEEKIFEQFYRAHNSLSSGIPGSGLGLTLARQIARAHGGDVRFQRRAGGGSIFILRLPAHE